MLARDRVVTIARLELSRRWRVVTGNPVQVIALAIAALFLVPVGLGGIVGTYLFGAGIASGDIETPLALIRPGFVYAWLFVAGFGGYRAYATALRPDRLDGYLTTVSHRELLAGFAFAELVLWGVPSVLLAMAGSLLFAAGTGSVLSAPVLFLTVCITLATALTTGFLVSLVVRSAGVRSRLLTRLRSVLIAVLAVVYFGVLFTQSFASVLEPVYRLLAPTPIGWYGDLALVGTVPAASIGRSVGTVLASAAFMLASAAVLPRLAAGVWYADGVHIEHEVEPASSSTAGRLSSVLPQPVAGVAATDWKRARRAPITLTFAVYPLFLLFSPAMNAVQTGTIGRGFPIWIVCFGPWIAGALFALNVVGNEGAVLPATLLSDAPGRALVAGHVVASVLLVVPVTLVAVVGLGAASPHSMGAVLTLAVSALVLAVAAPPIATGVGAIFPRFEAVSVSRSTEAIVPSKLAFTGYSLVVFLVAIPTLAAHSSIVGHAIASAIGPSPAVVRIVGTVASCALAVTAGSLSAAYAVRSVERFHLD
ncbi:hypothetical protein [Natrinema salsiterrestre]|uniref:Uncharacterized protein n=1 Tax=Natrinema salsiterrestre TaxID=2950540 RepID=A0A9Q4L0V3_9EURY|nr:hypothetical protein [Natrinema salsiterrestre]MDF9746016.1 hypothetical protein [Natrinema salsiterrestre]